MDYSKRLLSSIWYIQGTLTQLLKWKGHKHKEITMKYLQTFVYSFPALSCIIHINFIGNGIFYPKLPDTRVLKKTLKDIEFPLTFFLCAFQIENSTERYKNLGYKNDVDFFLGRSMFNSSFVGWGGHTRNGTNIGSVAGKTFANWKMVFLFHFCCESEFAWEYSLK